jgi:hypothetical protein
LCPLHEVTAGRQPLREPDGLSNAIDDDELAMAQLADDHVKTVGSEVNGSDDLRRGARRSLRW